MSLKQEGACSRGVCRSQCRAVANAAVRRGPTAPTFSTQTPSGNGSASSLRPAKAVQAAKSRDSHADADGDEENSDASSDDEEFDS